MTPPVSLSCRHCKATVRETDRWCPNCGTPITGVGPVSQTPISYGVEGGSFSWDAVQRQLRDSTLGQYEILTELGRGGMAAVFLAHEYALNRKVALKVMSPAIMLTDGMVERFHAEARTQANLTHANIVSVYAVRREDDLQYFVMQYVPGRSLQQVLRTEIDAGRFLSLPVIRSLLYQVGSALTYAHRHGVIHRDVKPANVMLNAEGDGVVTDFGIAKVMSSSSHTLTGTVVGTAPYMSPEQCYAAPLTPASDQYSLGILAYELLVGHPPFTGTSFAVMQAHTLEPPRRILPERPDCPPEVEAAIMTMLAKDKAHRFEDIDDALHALGAKPAPSKHTDPVRRELIRHADAEGVAASLADVLRVPLSPTPQTRARTPRPGTVRRSTDPAPQPAVSTPRPVEPVAVPKAHPTPPSIVPDTVAKIEPSPVPSVIGAGESFTLSARVLNQHGREMKGHQVQWSSSAPTVATVSADGKLVGVAHGTAMIEARAEDRAHAIPVTVGVVPIEKLDVRGMRARLKQGATRQLAAVAVDGEGRTRTLPIEWSSTDPAIASVDPSGSITTRSAGQVTLKVRSGTMERTFDLEVAEPVPLGRRLGGRRALVAVGMVAVIAAATLMATRDGTREDPPQPPPPPPPALRLEIESAPTAMRVGETGSVRLRAFLGDSQVPVPEGARWQSSDPQILQINAATGEMRALQPGIATVSVLDSSPATVSHSVTVERAQADRGSEGVRVVNADSIRQARRDSVRVAENLRLAREKAARDSAARAQPPTFEVAARREIERVASALQSRDRSAARFMFGDDETARIWRTTEGRAEIAVTATMTETSRPDNAANFFLVIRDRRTNDTLLSGEYRVRFDESSGVLKVFEIERLQR